MKDNLEELLVKYWEGETSLEQEKEIRNLLRQVDGYDMEKKFFLGIESLSQSMPKEFNMKNNTRKLFPDWIKIAAALAIFFTIGSAVYQYQDRKAEKKAYEQVMLAFNMIQTNMQKGTESLNAMHEFRHLNAAENLFNIKEQKK